MPITGTELSEISTATSAGAGDAAKIVLLNASGLIDDSMLPDIGAGDITAVTAGTGLTGGGSSGSVSLAVDFGTASGKVCQGNDSRLSNDRTASGLRTATTVVSIASATAPTAGQVLTAIDDDSAEWADAAEGTEGPPGADGAMWFWGNQESLTGAIGSEGDMFLDTIGSDITRGNVSQKISGTWTAVGNIRGEASVDGTQIRSGSGAPDNGVGVNGDYYLRTTTGQLYLKASGTYGLVLTMQLALTYSTGLDLTGSTLTVVYGSSSGTACQGNDSRLSDARTPTSHAASHKSAGGDSIKLDELAAPTDVTTLNTSTSQHGLCPKLPNDNTLFLSGVGTWLAPAGGGGGGGDEAIELWRTPSSPNSDDEEFASTSAPSGFELYNHSDSAVITPSGSIDPYSALTANDSARLQFHTNWRRSHFALQVSTEGSNKNYSYSKAVTVPTNRCIWTRIGLPQRFTETSATAGNFGLGFFGDSGGHASLNDGVVFYYDGVTSSTGALKTSKTTGGSFSLLQTGPNPLSGAGVVWEYLAIHKIGTVYHFWTFTDSGQKQHWGSTTFTPTVARIGWFMRDGNSASPGNSVFTGDFLRNIDSATQLPC